MGARAPVLDAERRFSSCGVRCERVSRCRSDRVAPAAKLRGMMAVMDAGASHRGAPPVAYAHTADGGHVGYQVFGEGRFAFLGLREWAASIDAVWEHPAHLRI